MSDANSLHSVNDTSSLNDAASLLVPGVERNQAFELHPVVMDKAKVPTPAIRSAFKVIESAIVHRDTGICFVADSRFGKSYAIEVIRQTLPQSFPQLPAYSVAAKGHDRPSERSLYTELLLDCGHGVSDSGTAIARRMRLLNLWLATAQSSGADRLILFVDEGQNWDEEDFTRLRDLSNDLAAHDIRLITIIFAHPLFLVTRTALMTAKRTDLIGRFMLHPRLFGGVLSLAELTEIMTCYDNPSVSEYPVGSGISYSQFFRPNAFRKGWRLEHEAGRCWAAFTAETGRHGGGHFQLGMQWIASAIRNFLFVNWQLEHGDIAGESEIWKEAVRASGFEFSLGVIQDPNAGG